MHLDEQEQYFVAVKILLRKDDELLILKDKFDDGWDLPGGRIKKDEFETKLTDIIDRKMAEEVGTDVTYTLGDIKTTFRHERTEQGVPGAPTIRIFAIGYEAIYEGGDIVLGEYMQEYKWVNLRDFTPSEYFRGGWCKGVEEYLKQI